MKTRKLTSLIALALSSMALAAVALQRERGYDLRSPSLF